MKVQILTALSLAAAATAEILYPSALDAAAIAPPQVSDLNREALTLGNGDLNALLWERHGALCLRVAKSDVWDAHVDTSADPPLLKVDVANQKWSGGGGNVPSWERPYPSPRCAAVVRIVPGKSRDTTLIGDGSPLVATGAAPARATTARLDVRSAVATVRGVSVRALADRKAFLIEADQEVSLKEIKAGHLPAAQLGEDGGVKWLHMKLPGDEDYSGMEYALARRR